MFVNEEILREDNVFNVREDNVFNAFVEEVNNMNKCIKRINENKDEMEFYKRQINDIKENCKNTVSVYVDNIGSSIEVYIDMLIKSLEEKIECLENYVKEDKEEVFKIYGKLWINYFPNKKLLLEEFNAGSFSLNNGRTMKDIERKVEDLFNTLHAIK